MKTRSSNSNFQLLNFNKNVTQLSNLHLSVSANFPPKILGPKVINATIGQAIEVKITAEHNSSDFFVFTVNNLPDVIILANTSRYLLIRWTPTSLQKVCAHILISVNQPNFINILVLRPFQLLKEQKTNGGYKHYPQPTHGLIKYTLLISELKCW